MLNQGIRQVVSRANENGSFIFSGKEDKLQRMFNGIFSFEGIPNDLKAFGQNFNQGNENFLLEGHYTNFKVNHVSLNKDWFIKYWPQDENSHSIYNIRDLSFSFFISNLNDTLANKSVQKNNFIWYATDKELNLVRQF